MPEKWEDVDQAVRDYVSDMDDPPPSLIAKVFFDPGNVGLFDEVRRTAKRYAKAAAPKDTGRLRRSVTDGTTLTGHGAIGSPLDYASYVEDGTVNMDAQPYLRPSVERAVRDTINPRRKKR